MNNIKEIAAKYNLMPIGNINGTYIFPGERLWKNPSLYKKCVKKSYNIYFCKPLVGTVVLNKVDQASTYIRIKVKYEKYNLEKSFPNCFSIMPPPSVEIRHRARLNDTTCQAYIQAYNEIYNLANQKQAYIVSDNNIVVLSGTLGEAWVNSINNLKSSYKLVTANGNLPITDEVLYKLAGKRKTLIEWTKICSIVDSAEKLACFIPYGNLPQKDIKQDYMCLRFGGKLVTRFSSLEANSQYVEHGYGDFVVTSKNPDGSPNLNDIYLINGKVFANTYDNRGWASYVDADDNDLLPVPPKILTGIESEIMINADTNIIAIMNAVERILEYGCKSCVEQIPFRYSREADNLIYVKPDVIQDYKEGLDKSAKSDSEKFKSFLSEIRVKNGKIQFTSYNVSNNDDMSKVYSFDLPATKEGIQLLKDRFNIYLGMLGYIPRGVQSAFKLIDKPDKYQFDGIQKYTVASGPVNRKLRLQDTGARSYERTGSASQEIYRTIDGMDGYFIKSQNIKEITVFRGLPYDTAQWLTGSKVPDDLSGKLLSNTAYTSTSLNLQSTIRFARGTKCNDGVVLAIKMPIGMYADYIHNIAGWREQFEVLWDRKYDIQIGNKIADINGEHNMTYHLYEATVIEHEPGGKVPLDTSKHQEIPYIDFYDNNGKVNFAYERIKGVIKEAYNILKKLGLPNIQIQEKFKYDIQNNDYIVIKGGKPVDGKVRDICFTYDEETRSIKVCEIVTVVEASVSYTDANNNVRTSIVTARNYWSDRNRNNGALDRNVTWETYEANSSAFSDGTDGREKNIWFRTKRRVELRGNVTDSESLPKVVANTILEYVRYSKDCTTLPLQEIARYFDTVFKTVIISEGYLLRDSMPINRVGTAEDEDNGYVDFKYHIDGDDDDSLILKLRMIKTDEKKVALAFSGESADGKVNESKKLSWKAFNQEVMEKCCSSILYTFASKLKLNHTRKIDAIMNYLQDNSGLRIVNHKIDKSGLNIHQKGNLSAYKIWLDQYTNKIILVKAEVKDRQATITFMGSRENSWNYIDSIDQPIEIMYEKLIVEFQQGLSNFASIMSKKGK